MEEQSGTTEAEEILSEFNKQNQPEDKSSNQETQTTVEDIVPNQETQTTVEEKKIEPANDKKTVKPRNIIFVGKKPLMTYVNATLTQISVSPVVTIKARGKSITQAVDISQMIVKRMSTVGYFVKDVRISLASVAPKPIFVKEAGDAVIGKDVNEDSINIVAQKAKEAATPITDMRGTIEFRKHLCEVLTRRALITAIERAKEKI